MKLYLITRQDLPPGARAAQLCHAMRQWSAEHPEEDRSWFEGSNTLVLLEAVDELALEALTDRAADADVVYSKFHEPDLDGSLTAVAIGPMGSGLVAQLPLALRERKGGLAL